MSRAGRPSQRSTAARVALRGMDGGPQLRSALNAVRKQTAHLADVVVVANGTRGPNVIDTRSLPAGGWVIEDLIPTGIVAAFTDLDDSPPATLLENGFDVVLRLHGRGAMENTPVMVSAHWREGLVSGREPPPPFWARFDGSEFVRCEPWERGAA